MSLPGHLKSLEASVGIVLQEQRRLPSTTLAVRSYLLKLYTPSFDLKSVPLNKKKNKLSKLTPE